MRLKLLALLLLFTATAGAQSCVPGDGVNCTPNLNLWLLPQHYARWDIPWNDNATIMDALSAAVVYKNPTASQIITQPAPTFTNFNAPLIFGSPAILEFGPSANVFDSALTRTEPGVFTLDGFTPGAAAGTLKLTSANALTGFQIGGTAPTGHIMVGNGTYYVDSATLPGVFYYQTVAANGAAQTQRPTLNFSSQFSVTDSASPARTNVGIANSGVTPGAYVNPSFTVLADGRISIASSNVSGIDQYFNQTLCTPPTSTDGTCTGTVTLPAAFADASYTVTWGPSQPNGAFIVVTRSGSLSAGSFPYSLTCTFNCSVISSVSADFHAHHS